jgi:hypothetical protein
LPFLRARDHAGQFDGYPGDAIGNGDDRSWNDDPACKSGGLGRHEIDLCGGNLRFSQLDLLFLVDRLRMLPRLIRRVATPRALRPDCDSPGQRLALATPTAKTTINSNQRRIIIMPHANLMA